MVKPFQSKVRDAVDAQLNERSFSRRKAGFSRETKDFVHCLRFQLKSDRSSFAVELGVHPRFLIEDGKSSALVDLLHCEFRERLRPVGKIDHCFPVESLAREAGREVIDLLDDIGSGFFDFFSDLPSVFNGVTLASIKNDMIAAQLRTTTELRLILVAARAHKELAHNSKALELAEYGFENSGRAMGPKSMFRQLVEQLQYP